MTRAKWIVIEGAEGVGKTTQMLEVGKALYARGSTVFQTKEPGTSWSKLTMSLRSIMLDMQYEKEITVLARELISQAIRSIHHQRVIVPNRGKFDFIIQDRGLLSGIAYGLACGNSRHTIERLWDELAHEMGLVCATDLYKLYDRVFYLRGNVGVGLQRAISSKQEFASGDVMEARGVSFMEKVQQNFDQEVRFFTHTIIDVDGKTIKQVCDEICAYL